MVLGGNIGYQLHFEQRNMVLQLQLALFQAPQLQLLMIHVARQYIDHRIEVAMFNLQFDDAALYVFSLRSRHCQALWKKVVEPVPAGGFARQVVGIDSADATKR
jgi:hypothetical protein